MKFYVCPICKRVVEEVIDGGKLVCCGKEMEELKANTKDASLEKHVPFCEVKDNEIIVKVGSVTHPMGEEHYIMWISQVTDKVVNKVYLKPGDKPETKFPYLKNSTIYAYCNIHGLWKSEVE